jgi:hypothetical protein
MSDFDLGDAICIDSARMATLRWHGFLRPAAGSGQANAGDAGLPGFFRRSETEMNETRELAKLRGLSVYGRDDIERLAKLTCVATDGRLPRADAPLRVGEDQWYRLTALRFLRGCRRTRPATGLLNR